MSVLGHSFLLAWITAEKSPGTVNHRMEDTMGKKGRSRMLRKKSVKGRNCQRKQELLFRYCFQVIAISKLKNKPYGHNVTSQKRVKQANQKTPKWCQALRVSLLSKHSLAGSERNTRQVGTLLWFALFSWLGPRCWLCCAVPLDEIIADLHYPRTKRTMMYVPKCI